MKKSDIMRNLLSVISEVVEIEASEILSLDKSEHIVDARHMLIVLLFEVGFYPEEISKLIGCTKRNVNGVICNFSKRCKARKMLRINYEIIKNKIGIKSLNKYS